jgi:hypothetical protein
MKDLETAYNQAMEMIKKGHSKEEVLLEFSQFKNELAPLLDISLSLLSLPKIEAPRPAMQRKYALVPGKNFWLGWMRISKFAGVSMSVMLLVSALAVTGYEAYKSGPGEVLFSLKKSAEQAQVLLAYNQKDKAAIQVAIAQQRLSEAQAIFSNPNSNAQQQQAALTELSSQTSAAVAVVNDVAQSDPKSTQSPPLLNSLENINSQQRSLLAEIKPDSQITAAAGSALQSLNADSATINQIKESVAIAGNNQTLAQLSANPNSVAVLGDISTISNNQITVEKTTFTVNGQTTITDSDGNTLALSDLKPKTKVNVVGLQNQSTLLAEQILLTSSDSDTAASGTPAQVADVTATGTQATTAATTTSTTDITLKKPSTLNSDKTTGVDASSSTSTETNTQNGSTAVGSFILEDPAPQFPIGEK